MGTCPTVPKPLLARDHRSLADVQYAIGLGHPAGRSQNITERLAHGGRKRSGSRIPDSRLRCPPPPSFGSNLAQIKSGLVFFCREISRPAANLEALVPLPSRRDFHVAI